MRNSSISVLAVAACLGMAACDNLSNKATPERLDGLVANGVDPQRRAKAETQLGNTLSRANSIAGLNDDLGKSAVSNPQAADLKQLLATAMKRNPDIGRAAQDINRADAKRMRAIFGYLPQISATVTESQVETAVISSDNQVFELGTASYPVSNTMLELRQPLIDMSRIYGIKVASTARTVSEAKYIATVQRTLWETFDAYLMAAQSKMRMDELQRRSGSLGRQASAESALSMSGLADETARRALLTEQARAESDLAIETTRYFEAMSRLAYLTGTAVSGVQPVTVPQTVMGTERRTSVDTALEAARKNNPEMLAIAISVVQSDLNRKQAIAADFGPVLDLFATVENETREGSRFGGGSETEETTTGVRLTLPIFNARGDGLRTLDANVDLRAAIVDYHATKRQLETEIAMTLERMKQLSTSVGRLSQAYSSANANVSAERARIDSGQSSEIALAARERLSSEMKMELDTQRIEYLRAWVKLQYLTGAMNANVLG